MIRSKKFRYLAIGFIFHFLIFMTANANNSNTEIKKDTNGYQYEVAKGNDNLGRVYTLSNGLKVYLAQNKLKPVIETRIVVGAGSKYDPDESTGLAHYLEHMLFKGNEKIGTVNWDAEKVYIDKISDLYEQHKRAGTKKEKNRIYSEIDKLSYEAAQYVAPNELDIIVKNIGGKGYNAYTSNDETVYVLEIPSNELEKWVKLERVRFGGLVLRLFHTELETVYEEFNKNQDNDFFWVMAAVFKNLYGGHPYSEKTTIGRAEDLKNPSMKSITAFYDEYYVANNMAIILSGDIDYDKTIKLIADQWEDFRKNDNLKSKEYKANDYNKITTNEVYGNQTDFVVVSYRFDGEINQEESVKLGLITELLQNNKAGLIDLNVLQKQKVLSLDKILLPNRDYTTLMLIGIPKEGQTLEEVKNIIVEEIENLKTGNYNEDLIQSVKNNVKLGREGAKDNNAYLVERFKNLFINNKDMGSMISAENSFDSLTKNDVTKFSNEKFGNNYVVVYKRSGDNKLKAGVEKPKITSLKLNNNNRSEFAKELMNEKAPDISPKFLNYKKDMKSFKLNNKNDVFYIKNTTSDIFKLVYVIERGSFDDKELKIALDYLNYLGTNKYTPEEFGEELYKNALDINIDMNSDNVIIVLSGLDDSFEKGIDLLQDYMLNVKADKEIYDNYASDLITGKREMKKIKNVALNGISNYITYGEKNPFNTAPSDNEIRNMDPEKLTQKIKDLFKYKHEVFYYGERDINSIKKNLNNKLEVKNPIPGEKNDKFQEKDITSNKVYYANYDSIQNDIMILSKGGKFSLETLPYSMMFSTLYSEGLSSIPFQQLREGKALAYTAYSYMKSPNKKNNSYYLVSYIGTQHDKTNEAVSSFMELLDNYTVTEDQFNKSKELILKNIENQRIIKDDVYKSYLASKKLGLKDEPREYVYNKIKAMTYEEFKEFFENNVSNQKYNMIVIGRKENILKSDLEKYGVLKELTLEEIFGY